jgi:hypothetical protein
VLLCVGSEGPVADTLLTTDECRTPAPGRAVTASMTLILVIDGGLTAVRSCVYAAHWRP